MSNKPPMIKLPILNCLKCGHSWSPRQSGKPPVRCPECGVRRYWELPKLKPEEIPTLTLEKDKGGAKE